MNLSDLYGTYDSTRKNQATPRQMLKIVIYAAMNRIYSSRDIESACKRDINFMYLLDGAPAPDHSTIARFISIHLSQCAKQIMAQVGTILLELGEISGGRIIRKRERRHELQKISVSWKRKCSCTEHTSGNRL
nr:transposase [Butyrivibrio sp. XPD2006]